MVLALTTLTRVQTALGIPSIDPLQISLINQLIPEVSDAITRYCGVQDFGLRVVTEYPITYSDPELVLSQLPVQGLSLSVSLTQNSTTVTLVSPTDTTGIFIGQNVSGPGIPDGTTVTGITANVSFTISNAATLTANPTPVALGIAVYYDENGFGGTLSTAFAANTQLQEGADYYVDYDNGPGSTCSSGIVHRTNQIWYRPDTWISGLVGRRRGPPTRNVKVVYPAGYYPSTIPYSLQHAAELLLARSRRIRMSGSGVTSESYEGATTQLEAQTDWFGLISREVSGELSPFRVVGI